MVHIASRIALRWSRSDCGNLAGGYRKLFQVLGLLVFASVLMDVTDAFAQRARLVQRTHPVRSLLDRSGAQGCSRQSQPNCLPTCRMRAQDQVWLINTRHLSFRGAGCECGNPRLEYYRYDVSCGWVNSSANAFFAEPNPELVTTVYVHGNRVTHEWAQDHGFQTYCQLTKCCHDRPIRHVIWSWPSDPIRCGARLIKDARTKATRTTANSYYLGWWLSRLPADRQVSLLGFSYGGRSVLGALQLLNGGTLYGCQLDRVGEVCVRPRIAIWASASEANWLCAGGCNERALRQLDRGLVIYNPQDPVLQRYERLMPGAQGPALGSVGVPCGVKTARLWQVNAERQIGKVHRFKAYMNSNGVVDLIRQYALWPEASSSVDVCPAMVKTGSVSEVPVGELPVFDLATTMQYEAERDAFVSVPEVEVPVDELPTFELIGDSPVERETTTAAAVENATR